MKSSAGHEVTRVGSGRWALPRAGRVETSCGLGEVGHSQGRACGDPCGLGEAGPSQGRLERRGRPSCSCMQVESGTPAAGQ